MKTYILTEQGRKECERYIKELEVKRKEILDDELDTAEETNIPTVEDIVSDLNNGVGVDDEGDYYNGWGVTDNYEADRVLGLELGNDFIKA